MAQARVDKVLVDWRIRDLKLTHKRVAAFLGVDPAQLSRMLSGTRPMSDEQLADLSRVLGMDVSLIELAAA